MVEGEVNMKLSNKDAFNILGISAGHITPDDIKLAYRKAAFQYHPDRNPAGLEMMQLINAAYEAVKDFTGEIIEEGNKDYGDQINTALNTIIGLGLHIEICGSWIWVSGNTKPHKDILKQAGFKWAPKKGLWHFRPDDYKSPRHKPWSMDTIRDKYGSEFIEDKQRTLQAA